MEEGKKGKSNVPLIIIIVVLLIAVLGLCGYIFLNKDNSSSTKYVTGNNNTNTKNESSQKNTETTTNTQETKTNSTITFDGSKSINSNEKNYTLSCQGNAGIWITVDSTQKVLTFSFTPGEKTFFKNVYKLAPGHYMTVNTLSKEINIEKYFTLQFSNTEKSYEAIVDEISESMKESRDDTLNSALKFKALAILFNSSSFSLLFNK